MLNITHCPRCHNSIVRSQTGTTFNSWETCIYCPTTHDYNQWFFFNPTKDNNYIINLENLITILINETQLSIYNRSRNSNISNILEIYLPTIPSLYLLSDEEIMDFIQPYLIFS
jgi:hypothetical protein